MGSPKTTTQSSPPFLRPLITLDTTVSHFLHTLFKPILPTFLLLLLEYSADFRFSFPVSLSLFLASPSLSSRSTPLILGLLLDLAIIGLIKLTFRRARPPYNPNMSPAVHADNFSFPSGHASRVLFLATLFHLILQNDDGFVSDFIKRWIKLEAGFVQLGVWVWAIITATSRVLLGRHFLFDVLAGVIIGVLEGIVAFLVFWF
ncbi:probable lipid phosphate phosphatase beta [Herrania umbratica]|uniref:Probable lipid phosphate phosphatase beta n=1 Tax=Herrania umbratica TaxID=108875 RepID=A0A6J1BHU0_9ROSI|nr:probable lipid phosphate phosphatase beta [Herrania umbratica]XP_021299019.1 probable lipid phosphate phosphatase beta [Herrania umbratica]XP_021299028.1 probable lipid phosphate phosphatase beta [Herrania umbratica]XP_021299036.1 probable lipid phosphate phosphatase beta [Herrania umbratica]XP_021299045.1 probable lipid phosphate phosphatase beta [Herrania umbratica]